MQTPGSRTRGKAARYAAMLVCSAAFAAGCTDLAENPPSNFTPNTFFQNDAQVQAALAGVYSGLRATQGDYWAMSQVSSDETIVPTRGTDWFDGGQWVDLWRQTYGPSSSAGNQTINGAYSSISNSIARANEVLRAIQNSSAATTDAAKTGIAEIRVLRAWSYFMLQDAFGGVPIITEPGLASQPRATRDSVARFIANELHAARTALPASWPAGSYGRVTQGAVDAILANLYLNWPVYAGTVSAAGLTPGPARYDSVLAVTDRIMNSGQYTLASDSTGWRANFSPGNSASKENIFVVRNVADIGLGLDFINRATHYKSYASPGGWNGFSMIADTYAQFDAADTRRSILLVGPQRALDTGQPITQRDNVTPLNFTTTISDITAAAENEGVRVVKFTYDPNHVERYMGNNFTIFRLGGVYLDRAEALWRTGNEAGALTLLNTLRARVYSPPQPLAGALSASVFLRERLTELTNEGKRRQDMIRLGAFLAPKQFKTGATAGYRILFPIPTNQLQANPQLTQNPGY